MPAPKCKEAPSSPRERRAPAEAAFRAILEQRLKSLENDLGEVKGRLNGLLFLVAGAVFAQIVLQFFHH